jgi:DNA repair protein RAD7
MPSLVRVDLRFAGQLKDRVIHYMLDRNLKIKHLQLDAANLISDASWQQLFTNLGKQLETLKLSNLDYAFTDETIDVLTRKCVNLRRLKLTECWKLGEASINAISRLPKLEHLTLNFLTEVQCECLVQMVQILGPNLRTLSLTGFHNADDRLLEAIHAYCQQLQKFRLTDNSLCTDKGYLSLFQGWINPPLEFVDLSSTRDVDNAHPDGPEEPVGLASGGLLALLRHSGSTVRTLNIGSCRHISHAAFEEAFQRDTVYPQLHSFDVSFHTTMDDFLIAAIFRSCPAIKKVIAFACFKVRDVRVPTGVALIGGLRAQDSIVMGVDYMDNLALSHKV